MLLVVAIFIVGFAAWRLFRYWWRCRTDNSILTTRNSSNLPTPEDFRQDSVRKKVYGKLKHLPFVIDMIEPKARKQILQEESVLSALHDRIVNATDGYRETSALCILSALVATFFTLNTGLGDLVNGAQINADSLKPILSLVGFSWPLIAAALALYFFSILKQHLAWQHFDAWRHWLETDIFPELGASRSTLDKLERALGDFNTTARNIGELLLPVQAIGPALHAFQGDLVQHLVPAIKDGLARVSVGLSDDALSEFRKATQHSARAVESIQDNQGRILTLTASSERRTAELAAAVNVIAAQSSNVAAALAQQAPALLDCTARINELSQTVGELDKNSHLRADGMRLTIQSVQQALHQQLEDGRRLTAALQSISPVLISADAMLREATAKLGTVAETAGKADMTLASITEPLQRLSGTMEPFLAKAASLDQRWQEAMLQMGALTDEIHTRTSSLEKTSSALTAALGQSVSELGSVGPALRDTAAAVLQLRAEVAGVSSGNKLLVSAFGELQALGQKLKNLGHGVTGHFNIWQRETREVFTLAQSSSAAVKESLESIEKVVGRLEFTLEAAARQATPAQIRVSPGIHGPTHNGAEHADFVPSAFIAHGSESNS